MTYDLLYQMLLKGLFENWNIQIEWYDKDEPLLVLDTQCKKIYLATHYPVYSVILAHYTEAGIVNVSEKFSICSPGMKKIIHGLYNIFTLTALDLCICFFYRRLYTLCLFYLIKKLFHTLK